MTQNTHFEETLQHVRGCSQPRDLRITDMRWAELEGAPYACIMLKLYTNQGLVGFGEVRDQASATYALMLKGRIIGENPCNIDRIFRKIQQFGGQGRQGGGVSAVEIALWDLAGKAYGMPVYQMLGGKFRDDCRIYCDTDIEFHVDSRSDGENMGYALKKRLERGYTVLKMDLGIGLLRNCPGGINAPLGMFEEQRALHERARTLFPTPWEHDVADVRRELVNTKDINELLRRFEARNAAMIDTKHPFTGVQITEKGLDYLENYVKDVRSIIGYEVPLAIDHLGGIGVEEVIKLSHRLEGYNIAWLEDPISVQYPEQWKRLVKETTIPICTGENIYLAKNFKPLLEAGGIGVAHPDPLSAGGIWQSKLVGDMAEEYGVTMALHQAATPIHAMAAAHVAVATHNCWACEFHANDVPWWDDLIISKMPKPLVKNGFIHVYDLPGLGIDDLNDECIREHVSSLKPGVWEPTDEWNFEYASDGF